MPESRFADSTKLESENEDVVANRLIFGCGYLGRRAAKRWRDAGDEVHVVTRRAERSEELLADGYQPIVADVTVPASLEKLPEVGTVLWAVGFDRRAGKPIDEVYVAGLRNVLTALPSATGRVIYISSTGVYGQTDGSWVDEQSPCEPDREGGQACLAAEQYLKTHRLGSNSIILRMAGIYGPDRIPLSEAVAAGEPISAPVDGFLNLIHVDDAASAIIRAAREDVMPGLFCISDGHPTDRRTYYEYQAQLLDAPRPTFSKPNPDSPASNRAASNKRVRNRRMLDELEITPAYPSFREGLAAIIGGAPSPAVPGRCGRRQDAPPPS